MPSTFAELYALDVSKDAETLTKKWTDKKTGEEKSFSLSYLHWSAAIKILTEKFPDFEWNIREWDGKTYTLAGKGAMVYVSVRLTKDGKERGCFLPVMNQSHEAIEEPDAFDINTAHWRCFVKACALHGLGLSLYEKDDAPADKSASKHPPMAHGEKGQQVGPLTVTVLGSFDLKGKGVKLDCLTEAGELVKVTVWARKFPHPPGQGEAVTIRGVWEEYQDRWSISAETIASAVAAEHQGEGAKPEPRVDSTDPAAPVIPDTPANRATAVRKYNAAAAEARELGLPAPVLTPGITVNEIISAGQTLRAAIDKKKEDAPPAPAASGKKLNGTAGKDARPW